MSKLTDLLEIEGWTIDEAMEQLMTDSVSPGICMNPSCDYTCEVEPDCCTGYCENCQTQTVKALTEMLLEGGL